MLLTTPETIIKPGNIQKTIYLQYITSHRYIFKYKSELLLKLTIYMYIHIYFLSLF